MQMLVHGHERTWDAELGRTVELLMFNSLSWKYSTVRNTYETIFLYSDAQFYAELSRMLLLTSFY